MSIDPADPRCPECGGPIGATATYCMHCSADLTDERDAADADGDMTWDQAEAGGSARPQREETEPARVGSGNATASGEESGQLLDPDGIVDDSLTVLVGIAGGLVVGAVGTFVLLAVTGSGWAVVFGLVAWLVATAHLVRRRTVQGAVSRTGYAVAVVLLAVPVIALSPVVDVEGGLSGRGGLFVVLLVFVAVPAAIAAGVGWVAGRFVPADSRGSEG